MFSPNHLFIVQAVLLTLMACTNYPNVNTSPYHNRAEYYWNKDVLLTDNKLEGVFMYGVLFTLPDLQVQLCSGYGANICTSNTIKEYLLGKEK
jgi:hypothetical protein